MPVYDHNAAIRARALEVCTKEGESRVSWRPEQLDRFCGLVRKWNTVASLVSAGDTERLWTHVADSLSLACVALRFAGTPPRLFDIGSGAGFPAIPLALALPAFEIVMVERSRRKAGFLENVIGELALLDRVSVQKAAFPQEIRIDNPKGCLITARAVEKPGSVWQGVRDLVANGAVFLCQWAKVPEDAESMFHVEQIMDDWTRTGLRLGALHVIRSVGSTKEI